MTISPVGWDYIFAEFREELGDEKTKKVLKNLIEWANLHIEHSSESEMNIEEVKEIKKAVEEYVDITKKSDLKIFPEKSSSFFYLSIGIMILLTILIFKNS